MFAIRSLLDCYVIATLTRLLLKIENQKLSTKECGLAKQTPRVPDGRLSSVESGEPENSLLPWAKKLCSMIAFNS